jgi:hypothetical protein
LNELDAERSFNLIDNIFIEESLRDEALQGQLFLRRAKLNKIHESETDTNTSYNDSRHSDTGPIKYTEQTEQGFVGLEAPLG